MPGPSENVSPDQLPIELGCVKGTLKFQQDCLKALFTLLQDEVTGRGIRTAMEAVMIDVPARPPIPCMCPPPVGTLCGEPPWREADMGRELGLMDVITNLQLIQPLIDIMIDGLDKPGIVVDVGDFGPFRAS
jgi:hypothetical protein